jgi:hypothetical protein
LFKAFQKEFANFIVSLRKFSGDLAQQGLDLIFRDRHDPLDDPADALRISWVEWAQKNARLVGREYRGGTFDVD